MNHIFIVISDELYATIKCCKQNKGIKLWIFTIDTDMR